MNQCFQIKQNTTIPMISIDIHDGNQKDMVGYFTDEEKIVIYWDVKEIVMTKTQALQICKMIQALIADKA